MNDTYIVVSNKPWGKRLFDEKIKGLPGQWWFASEPQNIGLLAQIHHPYYIFFLHWSELVPAAFLRRHKCVGFHMGRLPFERGGSPLQNQIAYGGRETMLTAFRMVEEIDAGPIYMQTPFSLEGLAEEIYIRAGKECAQIIEEMVTRQQNDAEMIATSQELWTEGDLDHIVNQPFKRRMPEQSEIPVCREGLQELFDHFRMLDADTYPRAFLIHNGYRYEFSRPALRDGRIEADVKITKEV